MLISLVWLTIVVAAAFLIHACTNTRVFVPSMWPSVGAAKRGRGHRPRSAFEPRGFAPVPDAPTLWRGAIGMGAVDMVTSHLASLRALLPPLGHLAEKRKISRACIVAWWRRILIW
jgi:hypothetical protein